MPFTFNSNNFPFVKITFLGKIKTDIEFDEFADLWEKLYERQEPFVLIFDTIKMKIPVLKYSIKMTEFIKKLKKKNPQYLQKSIIIVKKKIIVSLLDFIFLIQPPVAPVYVTKNSIDSFDNINKIKVIKKFYPRKYLGI